MVQLYERFRHKEETGNILWKISETIPGKLMNALGNIQNDIGLVKIT